MDELAVNHAPDTPRAAKLELRHGAPLDLALWDLPALCRYVCNARAGGEVSYNFDKGTVSGFRYFGCNVFEREPTLAASRYRDTTEMSLLERQEYSTRNDGEYDRALVALDRGNVCAVLFCVWIKDSLPFWRYHLRWLDVHEEYRNRGVGSAMLEALDGAKFLSGKILQLSCFSNEGRSFLRRAIGEKLTAQSYALIGNMYARLFPPRHAGAYDDMGYPMLGSVVEQ
jgi:GNAT superfamily N-acetyltransferase